MDREQIRTGLQEILKEVLDMESVVITDSSTARDFKGWDSLAHIDIILAAEDKFSVSISAIKAAKLKTVAELIDLIHEQSS